MKKPTRSRKKPTALRTDSGQVIPLKGVKENICSYVGWLQTKPPKKIRIRKKNSHKLVW